jgi:hypothetical protein
MCQTGTFRRVKDYLTILISETLQMCLTDIGYHRYFENTWVKNHAKNILDTEGSDFTDHNRINGLVFCFLNKAQLIVCL